MKNLLLLSLFVISGFVVFAGGPVLSLSPSSACAGTSFTITISGLPSGVSSGCSANPSGGLTPSGGGSVILAGTNVSAVAYGGSTATATITIPANFTPGTYGFSYTASNLNLSCAPATNYCYGCFTVLGPPAQPSAITGSATPCNNSQQTYSVTNDNTAASYTWTLPNGWTGTSTTSSITVNTNTLSGTISVTANNNCGPSVARTLAVTATTAPVQPGTISGLATPCPGSTQTYSIAAVNGATSYTWTLPGGYGGTSTTNSITTTVGNTSGTISVVANNSCGSSVQRTLALTLASVPGTPGAISGPLSPCAGSLQTYSVNAVNGATSYTWSLPNGWTGTSTTNSISTTVGSAGGTISVTANNNCGASAAQTAQLTVTTVPAQPGTISGNAILCAGNTQAFSVAPVNGATSYNWTLQNSWTGSSNTNSIDVTVDDNSGQVEVVAVNGCGNSAPRTLAVSSDSAPSSTNLTPAGNQVFCSGGSVVLNCLSDNVADYQWQVNGNDIQDSVASFYTATASGVYTCVASNRCGSHVSANSVTVTVRQAPAGVAVTPNGAIGICTGSTQTLTCNATDADSYQWMESGNDIANETSATYTANAAGTYTCRAINTCGSNVSGNSAVISITSTPTAPNLSSTNGDTLCLGDSTVISAALGYDTYTWSTGETTNEIKVGASGAYVVTVSSSCGTVASNPYNLVVNTPVTPVITATGNTLQAAPAGVSYVWFLNAITINNATAQTYTPTQNGSYMVQVTDQYGCSAYSSPFAFVLSGIESADQIAGVKLFPNPANNLVTVQFEGGQSMQLSMIAANGQLVFSETNVLSNSAIDISKIAHGIYFVKLSDGTRQVYKKLVIGQ